MNSLVPISKISAGKEGVRWIWSIDGRKEPYLESGSFPQRTKLAKDKKDLRIAAYTTSVSLGCILSRNNQQCAFCVTGNRIPFHRILSEKEIVLQNIFMALYDKKAKRKKMLREFAYMGQGEPGFNYENVKNAIIVTDKILNKLNIKTYRHIFATAGVTPIIKKLINDLKGDLKENKILLHLSIHESKERNKLMPINKKYPLEDVLNASKKYFEVTGRKAVVNFLILNNAKFNKDLLINNSSKEKIDSLLKLLDRKAHRVIVCELNTCPGISQTKKISKEELDRIVKHIENKDFEVKCFVSFGKKENLACGLLGGQAPKKIKNRGIGKTYKKAMGIINEFYLKDERK